MALYIKYRPQTFNDLIKQEHIVNILKPKISQDDYAHNNFLFYGPRGTWKTSSARIFAKAINCLNQQDGNPCNQCENCLSINAGKTLDIVEIDAASHTQVDNIREEILDKASYPPASLKKKVYIIDEVHMLSKNAFNALLKIMEEPPHYLVFILATTEIHKVPETIISRCQVFTFKKVPVPDLLKHLQMICEKEKIGYEEEALISIAKISDGCVRDAIKYVDQVSILGDITQDHVSSFLWVASDSLIKGFFQACLQEDIKKTFDIVNTIQDSGIDIGNFIKQCLVYIEEHFQENPSWFIICADILKNVAYGLRSFPIPSVLLKMEIYKALSKGDDTQDYIDEDKNSSKKSVWTKESELPVNKVITKEEISPSQLWPADIASWDGWSLKTWREILDTMIANSDIKHSIKNVLSTSCVLENNEEWAILYVFNKLQWPILQKAENRNEIENAFKNATEVDRWLQIVILSKEEYLAKKL